MLVACGQTPRPVCLVRRVAVVEEEMGLHSSPSSSCFMCFLFPALQWPRQRQVSKRRLDSAQHSSISAHELQRVLPGPHTAWARLERGTTQAFDSAVLHNASRSVRRPPSAHCRRAIQGLPSPTFPPHILPPHTGQSGNQAVRVAGSHLFKPAKPAT